MLGDLVLTLATQVWCVRGVGVDELEGSFTGRWINGINERMIRGWKGVKKRGRRKEINERRKEMMKNVKVDGIE